MKCESCGKEITQENIGAIRGLLARADESKTGEDIYLYSCDKSCSHALINKIFREWLDDKRRECLK